VGVDLEAFNPRDAAAGAAAGLAALTLSALRWRRPLPVIVPIGVLTSVTLVLRDLADLRLVIASVVSVGMGLFVRHWWSDLTGIAVAATLVGMIPVAVPAPARLALAATTALAALGLHRLSCSAPRASTAAVTVLAVGGVWAAVPDTEAPVLVLAAAGVAALACLLHPQRPITSPAAAWGAAIAPAIWAAAWGAPGRPAALWGALAGFTVLGTIGLAELAARWARGGAETWQVAMTPATTLALAGIQATCVVGAARWAARTSSLGDGALRATAVLVAAGVLTTALLRGGRQLR
jgi:hypothetical protein